jgi:hypothetical protein
MTVWLATRKLYFLGNAIGISNGKRASRVCVRVISCLSDAVLSVVRAAPTGLWEFVEVHPGLRPPLADLSWANILASLRDADGNVV